MVDLCCSYGTAINIFEYIFLQSQDHFLSTDSRVTLIFFMTRSNVFLNDNYKQKLNYGFTCIAWQYDMTMFLFMRQTNLLCKFIKFKVKCASV